MIKLIPLLALSMLVATPAGYKEVKKASGCVLMNGTSAESDGVIPMRAECHWPDVTPETFHKALADWGGHDKYWSGVVESTVKRSSGGKTLVYQIHRNKGTNDREILLWMSKKNTDGGGIKYSWGEAKGEALEIKKGNVQAARSDGSWEGKPHPDGGVQVTYQLAYDPGGKVPDFMVRWFQIGGLTNIVTELHEYLN